MKTWVLNAHPTGAVGSDTFKLVETATPAVGNDQILVRVIYLSMDPYLRGRIAATANDAFRINPGALVLGRGVGEVVESNLEEFVVGDFVAGELGWCELAAVSSGDIQKIEPSLAPIQSWLSFLGSPGRTAYFGLLDLGAAKSGDTVVVSAASGAVGQMVGQIAKIHDCRAVAVASSDDKLAWCKEIGYDAGVNYRTSRDLSAALGAVCPDGVDVFFDNTAGPIHDAVMDNIAPDARIIICGTISLSDKYGQPDIGPRYLRQILGNRLRVQGFQISQFYDRFPEAAEKISNWYRDGKIKFREDIAEGFENVPAAYNRLLTSANFGKQLVRVSDDTSIL